MTRHYVAHKEQAYNHRTVSNTVCLSMKLNTSRSSSMAKYHTAFTLQKEVQTIYCNTNSCTKMSVLFNPSRQRWACAGSPQNKHTVGPSHSPSDVSLSRGAQSQGCHDTDGTRVTGNWLLSPCNKNTCQGHWSVAEDRNWNMAAEVALPFTTSIALWTTEMLAAMHQTIRAHYFEVIHSQLFSWHSFMKPDDAQVTTYIKIWYFATATWFDTSMPSSGSSYTKFKTC
jgi:hypothetical protein